MKTTTKIEPLCEKTLTFWGTYRSKLKNVQLFLVFVAIPFFLNAQAAAGTNYYTQTGNLGTTYSWISCASGTSIITGDDTQASIAWPFSFSFYNNTYTTSNSISVATNGFLRLDGVAAGSNYSASNIYDLTSSATNFGQIVCLSMYDCYVGRTSSSWVKYLVTGTAPYRVLTIEYNNIEIPYSAGKYANVQVSFYETYNKIVLKLGTDNITSSGADMGLHSGVSGYFHKWQEVQSGTNNTWIEYTPPILVNSTNGTSTAYYSSLKAAFDKINNGTHQGDITIKIQESTNETTSAVLNASGSGSAYYSSVIIYPTSAGKVISGNLNTPLIDLNGADNVTIDGRVNATGSTIGLTINNTSTSSVAEISTIRFINDASNNTLKYCNIYGCGTNLNSGIIMLSTSSLTTGNDNNQVLYNNISSSTDALRATNAIFSLGSNAKSNSNNIVSNNNFYNLFSRTLNSNCILVSQYNDLWTINNNSFYETASFSSSSSSSYNVIKIDCPTGNSFTISDNFIGGTSSSCGGTAWTKTSSSNNVFNAIYVSVGNISASSIQNNTIKNFSWNNSANSSWTGINVYEGLVNIGNLSANTIGSNTGTNSIIVSGLTTGLNIYGIYISSSSNVNCNNNIIGSIKGSNSASNATNIYAIFNTGLGNTYINNNYIGSESTSSSIYSESASTSNAQIVCGVYTNATTICEIKNNSINNLNNNTSNSTVSTAGQVIGISAINGYNTIENNVISYLNISNANTSSPSAIGINISVNIQAQIIEKNTISNISNSYSSFTGKVVGIYYLSNTSSQSSRINANFIHSLSVASGSSGASVIGILQNADACAITNNVISLGGTTSSFVYGILDAGSSGKTVNIYFNSIYINGSNAGSQNSYAMFCSSNSNTRNIRNNIFFNARSRSGASGNHYAIYFTSTGESNLTADYNNYYTTGTGGIAGYYSSDKATLPIVPLQDINSYITDPLYSNAGGQIVQDYYSLTASLGVSGTGITTGFFGITRAIPPKIGALESNDYVWQGTTSTNFGTASNWAGGVVPANGASIQFAENPSNHCVLDQNRTISNITNAQNTDQLVLNGYTLTINGDIDFTNGALINGTTTSSKIILNGSQAQSLNAVNFLSNKIENLTINNPYGVQLINSFTIENNLSLEDGIFSIGANTITLNGSIAQNNGSLEGGSSSNMSVGGSGSTLNLPTVSLNNLVLNRSSGLSQSGNIIIDGTLTLTNGSLTTNNFSLSLNGACPTRTNGNIDVSNENGEIIFNNNTSITLPASLFTGTISNLTVNSTFGVICPMDITVTGTMHLSESNPTSTRGSFHMADGVTIKTLTMGANATNTGIGEVTGIIKRTTLEAGIVYTFGHPKTTGYFTTDGTIPTELSAKITIGSTPTWRTDPISREIEIIQTGGSFTKAMFTCHYLDTELNGNNENRLCFWTKFNGLEYGRSGQNSSENWVSLSNINVAFFPSSFDGNKCLTLDEFSTTTVITWNGSLSDSWTSVENWTPNSGPSPEKTIIIPDASTTPNSPTLPILTEIKSLIIEPHGVLNSLPNAQFTLNGGSGALINDGGTINANTSNFIFTNSSATVSGSSDLCNLTINSGAVLMMIYESRLGISGTVTNNGTWRTVIAGCSTVEYNGGNQTVVVPNAATNRYCNLILSGTGTKTLPSSNLSILGNLTIEDGVTTTCASELTIYGDLKVDTDGSFSTGSYNHKIAGNIENNGSFITASGKKIHLNGSTSQTIFGESSFIFTKLEIDNSSGIVIKSNTTVSDSIILTNGSIYIDSTTLSINGATNRTNGYFITDSTSNLSFGGSGAVDLTNYFNSDPSFNNLTVNRTGGISFGHDIGIFGILNLESSNPSATKGVLDLGNKTLTMSKNATTIGIGDVTGIIRRIEFTPGVNYSFGNQFTNISFADGGTYPIEVKCKVSIGTSYSWKSSSILRKYDFIQSGGHACIANISTHYLDSELNGNTEDNLSQWTNGANGQQPAGPYEWGVSSNNTNDNWVMISNVNIEFFPTAFTNLENTLADSETENYTWNGSISNSWTNSSNWTPVGIPGTNSMVIIPDASITNNDPIVSSSTEIQKINIHNNGILTFSGSPTLTLNGTNGSMICNGTINSATETVVFTSSGATLSGNQNLNNLTIADAASLTIEQSNNLSIGGTISLVGTGILNAAISENTINYNGTSQTIINPNGATSGFYNLTLSGSGIKSLPATQLNISGALSTDGSAEVEANAGISIEGTFTISNGTEFDAGTYQINLKDNFINNGTFTSGSESNFIFDGNNLQTISGSATTYFENFTCDNIAGLQINSSIYIMDEFKLTDGIISIGNTTLAICGTITQFGAYLSPSLQSTLYFGGTSELTLNDNLFTTTPSINNLVINRSGGVNLGNQDIRINGSINLTNGTLDLQNNKLIFAGNDITLTTGNIALNNPEATIEFANSASVTLPSSLFSTNINNLIISGSGGIIASENLIVDGQINLQSSNPSSTRGCLEMSTNTLLMGENATTIGIGDVTGIIKRQHTFVDGVEYSFGNQHTTINFLGVSGSTKPAWISCKVEIGTSPVWRSETIRRIYSFAQDAAGNDRVFTKLHYLDSELHGAETDESLLTFWNDYDGLSSGDNTFINGKTTQNTDENWIQLLGMANNFIAPSTSFGKQYSLGYSNVTTITWTGLGSSSYPGDWSLPGHWSGGVPTANDSVLIPATLPVGSCGYPDKDLLTTFSEAQAKTLKIESGATLDATNFDITIYGDENAWVNNGTFISGNHSVTFANGDISKTVTLSGNNQFNDLIITDKTNLQPITGSTTSIKGNLVCDGSLIATNDNTVVFNGSSNSQEISGTGTIDFYNLTMNNTFTNGHLTLNSPIDIVNTLELQSNTILSSATNLITMKSSSSVTPTGGSATSYIIGPICKQGDSAFTFPTGSDNVWAPIGIAAPSSASNITAVYERNAGPNNWSAVFMCSGSSMTHTSGVENWVLTTSDAHPAVTLYWKTAASGILDTADLVVAHYNGTCWENMGGTAYGNSTSGNITSSIEFTSYSPISFGTKTKDNTLPIVLEDFYGYCDNHSIIINWNTASESNNNYFTLEKSNDLKIWNELTIIEGAGNSTSSNYYDFADPNVKINNYYRLKQTDFDGNFTYSKIISVADCNLSNNNNIEVYPNPTYGEIKVIADSEIVEIRITDLSGKQINTINVKNSSFVNLDLSNLNKGMYIIEIKTVYQISKQRITIL